MTNRHRSAANHVLSDSDWLDLHFEACRPEYEAMLASAGFQRGWSVLDAGCGNGAYVPGHWLRLARVRLSTLLPSR